MTRKFVYLIGNPVEHSISPHMHNAAFKALGMDEWEYKAIKVEKEDLNSKIEEFKDLKIEGFNVTVPHKEEVIKLVDVPNKDVDGRENLAKLLGAVNTVRNNNGKFIGYNTDCEGFFDSLNYDGKFDAKDKKAVVLGAGGAARAVAGALYYKGLSEVKIYDVDYSKAKKFVDSLIEAFKVRILIDQNFKISVINNDKDLNNQIQDSSLLVNATPVGMWPDDDISPIKDENVLHNGLFVYDLVYNPVETKLLKLARSKGAKGITGLGMLVRQGAASFKLFTGHDAPVDVMMKAAQKALGL